MELKEGYKQTVIGVIPDDWKITSIGDFAPLQRGFDLPNRDRVSGIYPVVYSNGIVNFHNESQVKGPGVVTGRSGTIGKIHYVESNYWPHNTTLWVTRFHNAYPKYVYYLYLKVGFSRFSSGSGVPTLNRNDAHSYKLAVPESVEEQTAIANALSDTDALIQSLTGLITKKRQIKQGVMQALLNPYENGRLKEGWVVKTLGEVATFINGRAYSLFEWEAQGTPVIRLQNLTGRGEKYYYSNLKLPDKQYCVSGDLLFMWSATFGPKIWKGEKAIYHYHIWKIECKPGEADKTYLFYILDDLTERLKRSSSSGGTMLHVTKGKMESTEVFFPEFDEQVRIATILTDMDDNITMLETKLVKYQQIKQGMMQNLLTGRIRLVKPEGKAGAAV